MATYGEAYQHMKDGGKARLPTWIDPEAYIYYKEHGTNLDGSSRGNIYACEPLKNPSKCEYNDKPYYPRHASTEEDQSKDWILIEKE